MPFRFQMQKVLDYREQLEEEAKVQLALAERRLRQGQEHFDAVRTELNIARAHLMDDPLIGAGDRALWENYVKGLTADMAEAALQVRLLTQMAEEARHLLAARAVDKKMLEKLKERRKKQYIREEFLQEQRFNDEIATLRYKAPSF